MGLVAEIQTCKYLYTCMHTQYSYTYMHAYIRICIHTHIHTCMQAYIHMHKYIHTYTHIYSGKFLQKSPMLYTFTIILISSYFNMALVVVLKDFKISKETQYSVICHEWKQNPSDHIIFKSICVSDNNCHQCAWIIELFSANQAWL